MLPAFATSLVFVTYSYTGWNSASYIAGRNKRCSEKPSQITDYRNCFVTVSYILGQLYYAETCSGKSIGRKRRCNGRSCGNMLGLFSKFNIFIALQLIATISGYLWVGSRLTQAFAKDTRIWKPLSVGNKKEFR
jgi:APA family basic amino acid/polyamine antiporter